MSLEQVREAYVAQHAYDLKHPVKGMITNHIILPQGQLGNQKGQISHEITCSALPTGWLRTRNLQRQSVRKCWRKLPYSFDLSVMYWVPTLASLRNAFALPSAITQDFKQLFATIFLFRLLSGLQHHLCRYGHVVRRFQCWKCQGSPISTLMGKSWQSRLLRIARALPKMHASSMPTAQQKQTLALRLAVTDEMLATLKRLPIGYTKEDSPTFTIDEAGDKLLNRWARRGDHRIWPSRFKRLSRNNPGENSQKLLRIWRSSSLPYGRCRNHDALLLYEAAHENDVTWFVPWSHGYPMNG